MASLKLILNAMPVLFLVLCHVVGLGCLAARLLPCRKIEGWVRAVLYLNAGIVLLGIEMFLLGHLRGLHSAVLLSLSFIWGFCAAMNRAAIGRAAASLRGLTAQMPAGMLPVRLSCAVMLLLVFLSGLRPSMATDEIQYHWAAPVLWASAGEWTASPYRLTNGPALAEFIYTFPAVFHNVTAGHWTHTLLLITLIGGVAALAGVCGGSRIFAAAFCLSCPVILDQASILYNDVFAASLAVSAYAALLCERRDDELPSRNAALLVGLLFAGAVVAKPIMAVSLLGASAFLLFGWAKSAPFGTCLPRLISVLAPPVLLFALILLHTHTLIGKYWDSNGQYIVHTVSDPMWQTGAAAGRIPSVKDLLVLPTVPFTAPLIGQREPYGGRTGLLLYFAPFGFWYLKRLSAPERQKALWLTVGAALFFFLLGPVAIKTRFHIFVWSSLAVIAAIGYQQLSHSENPLVRRLALVFLYLLMWVGMLDAARILFGKA